MAYDLHINSSRPIPADDWVALVQADSELRMEASVCATNPKTGETIQIQSQFMASWIDPATKAKHYFHYSRGAISVKNPTDAAIRKMKMVASKLDAIVLGDEGESY